MEEESFVELLLSFVHRKHKSALWKQRRKLRVTNVYMNVNLIKQNAKNHQKSAQFKETSENSKHIDHKPKDMRYLNIST